MKVGSKLILANKFENTGLVNSGKAIKMFIVLARDISLPVIFFQYRTSTGSLPNFLISLICTVMFQWAYWLWTLAEGYFFSLQSERSLLQPDLRYLLLVFCPMSELCSLVVVSGSLACCVITEVKIRPRPTELQNLQSIYR